MKRDQQAQGGLLPSNDQGREHERVQDSLISSIPTEVLTLYTVLTGGTLALVIKNQPQAYLPYRWVVLVAAVVLTPASVLVSYRSKRGDAARAGRSQSPGRRVPVAEMAAATLAAAAWFLAVPGSPLLAVMDQVSGSLASTAITTGAVAVLWVGFAPTLRKGVAAPRGRSVPGQGGDGASVVPGASRPAAPGR